MPCPRCLSLKMYWDHELILIRFLFRGRSTPGNRLFVTGHFTQHRFGGAADFANGIAGRCGINRLNFKIGDTRTVPVARSADEDNEIKDRYGRFDLNMSKRWFIGLSFVVH